MTTEPTTLHFRAMATDVTLSVVATAAPAGQALERAREVFHRVEAACTRFDPNSPLMRANSAPRQWHVVPRECFEAVDEARRAHAETGGLFDPRILETLLQLGYDASLTFDAKASTGRIAINSGVHPRGAGQIPVRTAVRPPEQRLWRPELDDTTTSIRLGDHPIDLGGIGKGLAVRWAADELALTGAAYLVEAGGDLQVGGNGPEGEGWLVGIEDPAPEAGRSPELIAVLRLADAACATSSVRVRAWHLDGRPVHHLIDPRTGDSAASGLRSVTVVGPDPAWAEVWSKALFLVGRQGIARICRTRGLAAYWVGEDGAVGRSEAMAAYVGWEADPLG